MSSRIYIFGHKPVDYGWWEDRSLYQPIQLGDAERFLPLRETDGNNISEWNPVFSEFTGMYWIWQNPQPFDYIGICHYRRRLDFNDDYDFDSAFRDFGAIAADPIDLGMSVYDQYRLCHCRMDMDLAWEAVEELYPEYLDAWDRYIMNGSTLYYGNGLVLRKEDFDRLVEFEFKVMHRVFAENGWSDPQKVTDSVVADIKNMKRSGIRGVWYQSRIGGFLSERLTTLFLLANFDGRILNVRYRKFEGV